MLIRCLCLCLCSLSNHKLPCVFVPTARNVKASRLRSLGYEHLIPEFKANERRLEKPKECPNWRTVAIGAHIVLPEGGGPAQDLTGRVRKGIGSFPGLRTLNIIHMREKFRFDGEGELDGAPKPKRMKNHKAEVVTPECVL